MSIYITRLILLAALLAVAFPTQAAGTGDPAPDFRIQGPNAEEPFRLSDLRGRVVYVDFWASWCDPCRQSFPWMNKLYHRYADKGLVVVAVNLDESRAQARRFLDQVPADFPVVLDPEGTLAGKFGVEAMPSSYLVGPNGRILHRELGFRLGERERLERLVSQALESGG